MDFFKIKERSPKRGVVEIYPDFVVCRSKDLMIRGNSFYAVWDAELDLWSTDEYDVQRLVDQELWAYKDRRTAETEDRVKVQSMADFSSNAWANFKNYLKKAPDNFHQLDEKLTFANSKIGKRDYVSKRLGYSLEAGRCDAYEEMISTLYDEPERAKLEWAIGAIISGDARDIQKFVVLYGEAGAGKSTILNIVQKLFDGYYTTFEAKALTAAGNAFSTEVFRSNPLVAIQHDGDLSRIEDNTKLNSIVSHEEMVMNEKFKASYTSRINSFLFMATNRPVKITDAKSGIIRRLIDVKPSGRKLPPTRYQALYSQIDFELGAIAKHCEDVYLSMGKNYYASYRPLDMIFQTDVFFNFVESCYDEFNAEDGVSLIRAYDMYKAYCDDSFVEFKLAKYKFREELKNYFDIFQDRARIGDKQVRSWYSGFQREKFTRLEPTKVDEHPCSLVLDCTESLLDKDLADCPAQYANEDDIPRTKWINVKTKLADLDTKKVHYVKPPSNHIVIDFDLKDDSGKKSAEKNLEAASHWTPTYAEFSKGGSGIHLHYIFDGDASKLSRVYDDGIEIKVFTGDSSLRRRLSKCNNLPVAHISTGLPMKEERKTINVKAVQSEQSLREQILRNLNKEIHPATKPSIDFIYKILEDAYESGLKYDVSDMRSKIFVFASKSTNNAEYCMKLVSKMKFKSETPSEPVEAEDETLVFYDVEVFPNLFLVNWKEDDGKKNVTRMINPTSADLEPLMKRRLVGFNCRRYDNHILYARYALGYNNHQLYELSKKIVGKSGKAGNRQGLFGEAYNISYTDIYDFSSTKQSLKKFEIELGIHHQELGLPWDEPVPEELWPKVAEYCDNDVLATEAVFHSKKIQADWTARQILAAVAGMSVNDTTNSLTTRIIFGADKSPQSQFNYRFMGAMLDYETYETMLGTDPNFTVFDDGKPIFPGYRFDAGKSTYRGEEVGEGGYVYSEPGMYFDVALLDIASMHPSSIVAEQLFGEKYTARFNDILQARIAIKHGDFDRARGMLDGKLAPYLEDERSAKDLAKALKIAINSVYGLTSAKFENPFRDIRNVDNIVAKRGALFMVNLKHEVQARGFTVAHIKTDSIKIPNATPDIIAFVQDYGRHYGYNFEHEATYDRMCLVNDAVYIAKFATADRCCELYGADYVNASKDIVSECKEDGGEWTATGAQFAQPYVFKTLFSKEPIIFSDMCEAKSVSTSMELDMNEMLPDVSRYENELEERRKGARGKCDIALADMTDEDLEAEIEKGHDYKFIGKTGLFCPVQKDCGGGLLTRVADTGKHHSVTGAKDYRWLEAEYIQNSGLENCIDQGYYRKLVDQAVDDISKYGDFELFVGGRNTEDWSPVPCGDMKYPTCFDCMKFLDGTCEYGERR